MLAGIVDFGGRPIDRHDAAATLKSGQVIVEVVLNPEPRISNLFERRNDNYPVLSRHLVSYGFGA